MGRVSLSHATKKKFATKKNLRQKKIAKKKFATKKICDKKNCDKKNCDHIRLTKLYNFAFGPNFLSINVPDIFTIIENPRWRLRGSTYNIGSCANVWDTFDCLQLCLWSQLSIYYSFRDIRKKYLGQPLKFGIRVTFLPISPEPLDRFCSSLNLAWDRRILKKDSSKSV